MKKMKTALAVAAAASLAAAPMGSALAAARTAAPVGEASELGGEGSLAFLALGILAAFIAITVINDDDEDEPVSA